VSKRTVFGLAAACIGLAAIVPGNLAQPAPSSVRPDVAFLAYGGRLVSSTKTLLPRNVSADLNCDSCHRSRGTVAHGLSLKGSYTTFPKWNARAGRYIEVQDRIAECFLYSMNGKPPAYYSRQMIAITAYIASLSEGVPLGSGIPGQALIPVPSTRTNPERGSRLYASRCAACHGANGGGSGDALPPLWGPRSFNTGAGMFRQDTLAAFVRYNMPLGSSPNTLSVSQANDVAAYILGQRRPRFRGQAPVIFQPQPAHFF